MEAEGGVSVRKRTGYAMVGELVYDEWPRLQVAYKREKLGGCWNLDGVRVSTVRLAQKRRVCGMKVLQIGRAHV